MKKMLILSVVLLLLGSIAVSALSAGEAKQKWLDAKENTADAKEIHQDAKLELAKGQSDENREKVVKTGKDVLNSALDEAEAWLVWKRTEAEENGEIPGDLKQNIEDDVEANLDKIGELRQKVGDISNQFELGAVTLEMVGKYFELLTDVARNTGSMWAYIGDVRADKIEEYEQKLRETAEEMEDNDSIIGHLDDAKSELETARRNIENAADTYKQVKLPGTPLIKFGEGNNYLRAAKANLIASHMHLNLAFREMVLRGE